MIEYQRLTDDLARWNKVHDFQLIRTINIKYFRFRFHGQLVVSRDKLNAYLEKEIILARLKGRYVSSDWLAHYNAD